MYVSGFNIPGFLPDADPTEHETLADAKESLVWWIEQYIDCMAGCGESYSTEESVLEEFKAAPAQLANVYVGDFVYWISEA